MRKTTKQPIDRVRWMDPGKLVANDYNPNKVPPPEFQLLKISILEDGWTQPIVAQEEPGEDGKHTIIDGFHRWTLGSTDPDIQAASGGKVPVVLIARSREERILATVRHNRARGEHGVLPMARLTRELIESGMPPDEVMRRLGMEDEEVERLTERAGLPGVVARTKHEFSSGWVPGVREDAAETPVDVPPETEPAKTPEGDEGRPRRRRKAASGNRPAQTGT